MIVYVLLQAEEFQEVVTIMREFLPEAESQLKFRSLPDDEVAIMQMIEKHEVCGHSDKTVGLNCLYRARLFFNQNVLLLLLLCT